ncbi:MAG: hypothetical protein QM751_06610 [Paludibacteraceae bacterium]
MRKTLLIIIMLSVFLPGIYSQNNFFQKRKFTYKGDTLRYQVLFPENYDKTRSYPLVLVLHGAGERGSDNEKQMAYGTSLFTNPQNRKEHPSIVIFPQCPAKDYWVKLNKKSNERFRRET